MYEDISKELLIEALLFDSLTGLGTRLAYDEANKLPIQVGIDHAGLHDFNEQYGRDIGDWLLCQSAEIFIKHVDEVYRAFSDKFVFQAESYEDAEIIMKPILADLSSVNVTLKNEIGNEIKVAGIPVYYGVASTMNEALMKCHDQKN